jgi:hypothetical protein
LRRRICKGEGGGEKKKKMSDDEIHNFSSILCFFYVIKVTQLLSLYLLALRAIFNDAVSSSECTRLLICQKDKVQTPCYPVKSLPNATYTGDWPPEWTEIKRNTTEKVLTFPTRLVH